MNIIFMGTPEFAVPTLEKLIKKENVNISLVITQPDRKSGRGRKIKESPVKITAVKNNLELYQPQDINDKKSINLIMNTKAEYIIVVAYGQILSKKILEYPDKGCINVHASILPKYRGAAPINWAIINGEKETGVTTMLMEEGLDTGDILKIKKIKINEDTNAGELHDILKNIGAELLIDTIEDIETENVLPKKQDDRESSYAPMLNKSIGFIDWKDSAKKIHDKIRGLHPWPGAYTNYEGEKLKIVKSTYKNNNKSDIKGEIVKVSEEGIEVQTGDGILIIEKLQVPGKRKMTVKDYLLGNDIKVNKILK